MRYITIFAQKPIYNTEALHKFEEKKLEKKISEPSSKCRIMVK